MNEFYGTFLSTKIRVSIIIAMVAIFVVQLINTFTKRNILVTFVSTIIMFVIFGIYIFLSNCAQKLDASGDNLLGRLHRDTIAHLSLSRQKKAKQTILDVGCGYGSATIGCAKTYNHATVIGVDSWKFNKSSLAQCETNAKAQKIKKRVSFQEEDLAHLSFEDGSFDGVMSCYAFHREAIYETNDLILEMLRVLKKGGSFSIIDNLDPVQTEELITVLKALGYKDIHYTTDLTEHYEIPKTMNNRFFFKNLAMLYGIK